ncbi:hypothetical protein [Microlunatus antarcticus]|uniref:Uncharacterized protein n=1 Tax=Microlunatus antarcticus TaxID=53388 RepID=A0A7W5JY17_9ACTN|nr:hypothetical protein [Microlunatus antarcticus]MBB3328353.1 hypothetical protein [Microlunatus antarcticus]
MSTDPNDRPQPSADDGPDKREAPKSSLSIAQIVGGALAAMTAAALGSRLSLAGTVVGAAFASIIAAVAGTLYTASLRRTSQGVSTVIARVRPASTGGTARQPGQATATTPPTSVGDTGVDATDGWPVTTDQTPDGADVDPDATTTAGRSRVGWKQVVVGALLMFVVAALVLTGIELATGRALSGGTGTTVGQVAEPSTRPSPTPTARPSASPTPSAAPSSTVSAAPSATAAPSSTPSSEPTAAPTPSSSPVPSDSPTPVASSTPTAAPSAPGATPTS